METFEKLAIAQAMYKQLAAAIKTNEPDNLRGAADAEIQELNDTHHVSSVSIPINGKDVGIKIGITPASTEMRQERVIKDSKAFVEWCQEPERAKEIVSRLYIGKPEELLELALMNKAGEIPDGTEFVEVSKTKAATTRLTGVKAEKIVEAYGTPEALNAALHETLALPEGK